MTITGNTAACKRGFSCMNSQKRDLHTQLVEKTLNKIMFSSNNDPSVDECDTSPHMSWMGNSYGTEKRYKEHKTNQGKCKNEKKESIQLRKQRENNWKLTTA